MDKDTIAALLSTIQTMPIPQERNPFMVYDWMYERFPEEVNRIAKNMFNGEVVIIPTNYKENKDAF